MRVIYVSPNTFYIGRVIEVNIVIGVTIGRVA
jgi:hypothetical protein